MKQLNRFIAGLLIICLYTNCSKDAADKSSATGAGGSTARFTIIGNYLYVVDNTNLKSFDISNPAVPVYRSTTPVGINIETIFPYEDKLFIGSSFSMYIYSLSNPQQPTQIGRADYQIRMACDPVIAKDSVAYATLRADGPCGGGSSELVVYNIKNMTAPVLVGNYFLDRPHGLGMSGNALYVCEGDGLTVFDITDRYHPVEGVKITNEVFHDVIPYNNILIAQVEGGVALYDIGTNPQQPVFISKII